MLLAQTGQAYSARQRLLRGDVATVAMAERELVGYAWVTFRERWISEIRATIVPQDRDVLGGMTNALRQNGVARGCNTHYQLQHCKIWQQGAMVAC